MDNSKAILLVGSSIDGKVTLSKNSSSKEFGKLLTKEMNQPIVELRKWADAVITSSSTVAIDNPNMHPPKHSQLVRCVIDRSLNLPETQNFFDGSCPTLIFCEQSSYEKKKNTLKKRKLLERIPLPINTFFPAMKEALAKRDLKKLLFEGGGTFNRILLENNVIDEIVIAYFPFIIGGSNTPTIVDGSQLTSMQNAFKLKLKSSKVISGMVVNNYLVLS